MFRNHLRTGDEAVLAGREWVFVALSPPRQCITAWLTGERPFQVYTGSSFISYVTVTPSIIGCNTPENVDQARCTRYPTLMLAIAKWTLHLFRDVSAYAAVRVFLYSRCPSVVLSVHPWKNVFCGDLSLMPILFKNSEYCFRKLRHGTTTHNLQIKSFFYKFNCHHPKDRLTLLHKYCLKKKEQ